MTGWTHWVGWAILRLLRMLPIGAIPIPSIEFKIEDAEGVLQVIFVQGLAKGSEHRTSEQMQHSSSDPVATTLVPNEVMVRQWTEVCIDMADYDCPLGGRLGLAAAAATSSSSSLGPGVRTTSCVKIHLDGVRTRVEGMGYHFKYKGGYLGYEDEGIASVDLEMGKLHEGFAADMEIEMGNESAASSQQRDQETGEDENVEGREQHDCEQRSVIVESDAAAPANLDVQTALHRQNTGLGRSWKAAKDYIDAEREHPPQPLFSVVRVDVEMRGLHFHFDKSRYWILNKLFVQPLAGPVVARVVNQAMKKMIMEMLQDFALGLGEMSRDAARKAEMKRIETADEGLSQVLRDWWGAMLNVGPTIFGRSSVDDRGVQTKSNVETTSKGFIYKNVTTTDRR